MSYGCFSSFHFIYKYSLKLGSSLPGNLSQADLMTRVFTVACQYSVEQWILFALRHPSLPHSTSPNTVDLKGIVDELAIRLDKSFQLTKDQKVRLQSSDLDIINVTYASLSYQGEHSTSLSRANLQANSDCFQRSSC